MASFGGGFAAVLKVGVFLVSCLSLAVALVKFGCSFGGLLPLLDGLILINLLGGVFDLGVCQLSLVGQTFVCTGGLDSLEELVKSELGWSSFIEKGFGGLERGPRLCKAFGSGRGWWCLDGGGGVLQALRRCLASGMMAQVAVDTVVVVVVFSADQTWACISSCPGLFGALLRGGHLVRFAASVGRGGGG